MVKRTRALDTTLVVTSPSWIDDRRYSFSDECAGFRIHLDFRSIGNLLDTSNYKQCRALSVATKSHDYNSQQLQLSLLK